MEIPSLVVTEYSDSISMRGTRDKSDSISPRRPSHFSVSDKTLVRVEYRNIIRTPTHFNGMFKYSNLSVDEVKEEVEEEWEGERENDDLFKSLRYFLIFGKLIGLIPIQGIFQHDIHKLRFR